MRLEGYLLPKSAVLKVLKKCGENCSVDVVRVFLVQSVREERSVAVSGQDNVIESSTGRGNGTSSSSQDELVDDLHLGGSLDHKDRIRLTRLQKIGELVYYSSFGKQLGVFAPEYVHCRYLDDRSQGWDSLEMQHMIPMNTGHRRHNCRRGS